MNIMSTFYCIGKENKKITKLLSTSFTYLILNFHLKKYYGVIIIIIFFFERKYYGVCFCVCCELFVSAENGWNLMRKGGTYMARVKVRDGWSERSASSWNYTITLHSEPLPSYHLLFALFELFFF